MTDRANNRKNPPAIGYLQKKEKWGGGWGEEGTKGPQKPLGKIDDPKMMNHRRPWGWGAGGKKN